MNPISNLINSNLQTDTIIQREKLYFDAARERPLDTTFWYDSKNKTRPLIIFSHGWNRTSEPYARFRKQWVRECLIKAGYNYLAIEHRDDNFHFIKRRVQDIAFIIDQLKKDNTFEEYMKTASIGITGFSKGGATALATVGARFRTLNVDEDDFTKYHLGNEVIEILNLEQANKDLSIDGIKAAVLLQPGWILRYSTESLAKINVPVLVLDKENEDPIENCFKQWTQTNDNVKKILLPGNSHFVLLDPPTSNDKNHMPPETYFELFESGMEGVDREEVHRDSARKIVDFFDRHLKTCDLNFQVSKSYKNDQHLISPLL
ncbi:MAG TPA: hypothetical protein VGP47_07525 [Parachlamydiaceae bacterium]|nr:hypothetical protein [Parachlamydiaceae bacterium]